MNSLEPPTGVTLYASSGSYIAEKPRRKAHNGIAGDIGGWDVGDGFELTEPERSSKSEWRISIVDGEVYAVLRRAAGMKQYTFDGPVWLITRLPERFRTPGGFWSEIPAEPIQRFTLEIEKLRGQPDSLLLAVQRIQCELTG